jgi:hypothetical protein
MFLAPKPRKSILMSASDEPASSDHKLAAAPFRAGNGSASVEEPSVGLP